MTAQQCFIGLGSNLGDSRTILQQAVAALAVLAAADSLQVSRLYRSPPMGPQDQPDYLNAVVGLQTTLAPLDLLDRLQAIENAAGRVRLRRWGERTLDLDLLLYGDEVIDNARLTVPHVGILARDFVVLPLLDIAPSLRLDGIPLAQADCIRQATSATAQVLSDTDWIL